MHLLAFRAIKMFYSVLCQGQREPFSGNYIIKTKISIRFEGSSQIYCHAYNTSDKLVSLETSADMS